MSRSDSDFDTVGADYDVEKKKGILAAFIDFREGL